MGQWLSLLSYSAKYNISLSTLRRRIKNDTISFKQENGKYFIEDDGLPPPMQDNSPRQSSTPKISNSLAGAEQNNVTAQTQASTPVASQAVSFTPASFVEASVLTSANRLVEELKSAYAKILQEKEELISHLKEEIEDLRMLVRIMEQQAHSTKVKNQSSTHDDIFFGDVNIKDL